MTNVFVESLARLISKYHDELKAGGVECRLVVPAPTASVAASLQASLQARGLPSYLVVPHTIPPDEALRRIRAEAVTSVRQGDMIIVVWPGEMSRIQDSVIGAGGAIRNFAFGDEWPWIDDGNEYFRFIGPVMHELFHGWKIAPTNVDAYSIILEASIADCKDSLLRGRVFLDDFICKFDPAGTPLIGNQVDLLLFQLGIPSDAQVSWSDADAVGRYFSEVRRVTNALVERIKLLGGKQELLDRIEEIESDLDVAARMATALGTMIDRLSIGGDTAQVGLLALHGSWESQTAWQYLTLPLLRQLLNIAPPEESVALEVKLSVSAGAIASDDKTVVLVEDGKINLRVKYSGLSVMGGAELFIRDKVASPYFQHDCVESEELDFELSFEELFGGRSGLKKIVKVAILRGADVLAAVRIPVYRCDSNHPFVALFSPFSKVLLGRAFGLDPTVSEEAEIIEVKEATTVTVVVWEPALPPVAEVDDKAARLIVSQCDPHVFSLERFIDPGLDGSGRTTLDLRSDAHQLAVDFEAKDIVRGEFTLERELMVKLSEPNESPNRPAIRKLIEVFAGAKSLPYPGLGGVDDLSRSRISFARAFENDAAGRPIIANLFAPVTSGEIHEGPLVRCQLDSIPNVFKVQSASPAVAALLDVYAAARVALKDAVSVGYPANSPWPIYALLPLFIDNKSEELYKLLCDYLKSYLNLLEHASSEPVQTWGERFRLTCSDCVVHWDENGSGLQVVLVGPWHPIVLAKRYMVQSALFAAARRYSTDASDDKSHVLVRLLDQVNAVRWFAVPAPDGVTYESFYSCATSDPGWLAAFQNRIIGTPMYAEVVRALRQVHGLETSLALAGGDKIARTYLQDFFNAYPTRRAISVIAHKSYSTPQLVSSAQSLLFDGDVPSAIGRQLPGGVHLGVANDDELGVLEWKKPSICVYQVSEGGRSDAFSDIELLSPGWAESSKDKGQRVVLPRGKGHLAAFTCPLKQVGELSSGELSSRSFERDQDLPDDSDDIGVFFAEACRRLARLPDENLSMSWRASIPAELKRLWTVVPGNHIDPAVFVSYVSAAASRGMNASLWDYSMSLTGTSASYFVLSQIPESISHELNKSPVLGGKPLAPAVLGELGRVGMALGSESLRSGSKALGVIGVVAAVRLFFPDSPEASPIRNSGLLRGFLLPVDSFRDILGESLDGQDVGQRQRADLVAIQLGLLNDGNLAISCSAIECKYTSGVLEYDQIVGAMHQADATLRRVASLIATAQQSDGVPERLALVALISFGLRLSIEQTSAKGLDGLNIDGNILQRILDGKLTRIPAKAGKVVVITECGANRAGWAQRDGLVIRVCENHWPGLSNSAELQEVRERVSQQFEPLFSLVANSSMVPQAPSTPVVAEAAPSDQETSTANDYTGTAAGGQSSLLTNPIFVVQPPSTPVEAAVPPREDQETPAPNDRMETETQTPSLVLQGQFVNANLVGEPKAAVPLKPIVLGSVQGSPIYFDPQKSTQPLDNNNIMVTGSSGKGKTQFIKAFTAYLRQQNRHVLMIDFKNDFASDLHFIVSLGLKCCHVSFDGLPFNPLIPVPLKRPNSEIEYISISEHINGLVDIFRKTFNLGDQQEVAVKNAIREAFEQRGIPARGTIQYDATLEFPDFNDVGERLFESNPNAYNRLDPLFDLRIFPPEARRIRFDSMLNASVIVDVSQIQNDRIKNAVAKILVISAHRYYNARPHSGVLKQFFIFDEAHRILDTEFVLQFVRECRAYGVGVLLSSQYPSDFPADISSSLNTKVIHGNGPERDRVKEISRTVGNLIPEEQIAGLEMFQAIVANPQYPALIVNTLGYPHYLILRALGDQTIQVDKLHIPGIDPTRLDVSYLLELLMKMGLVELVSEGYRCTRD